MRTILALGLATLIPACDEYSAQTTSGAEYLAASQPTRAAAQTVPRRAYQDGKLTEIALDTVATDQLVREAAAVEPLLKLPARIGLARIENGWLSTIPDGEAALWAAMTAKHVGLGAVAAIDPFLAAYTVRTVLPQDRRAHRRDAGDLITLIRLGAARQHMDAVLIYEIGARTPSRDLPGLRVLGAAPLPARPIEKEGIARAFLMDVRNGYPYGVASASVDLEPFEDSVWDDRPEDLQGIEAKTAIAKALIPEVEAMFGALVRQMQTRLAAN